VVCLEPYFPLTNGDTVAPISRPDATALALQPDDGVVKIARHRAGEDARSRSTMVRFPGRALVAVDRFHHVVENGVEDLEGFLGIVVCAHRVVRRPVEFSVPARRVQAAGPEMSR
jgi:hypothetical protein